MKKFMALLLACLVLFSFTGCRKKETETGRSPVKPAPTYRLASGESPSVNYRIGVTLSKQLGRLFEGTDTSTVETMGSVANVELLHRHKAELALVQQDVAESIFSGTGPYRSAPYQAIREVAVFPLQPVYFLVPASSPIRRVEDLKGKKVAVGAPGSGSEVTIRRLLRAFRLNSQDVSLQYLSFADQLKALENGAVDAAFIISGLPSIELRSLFLQHSVRPLDLAGPQIDSLIQQYGYYEPVEIPANTYAKQPQPSLTFGVRLLLLANEALTVEDTYAISQNLAADWTEIRKGEESLASLKVQDLFLETGIPYSEGTIRYLNERSHHGQKEAETKS